MNRYPFADVEPRWQRTWVEQKTFRALDARRSQVLLPRLLPVPSGSGLHVGHLEGYTATDILCRYKRMKGFNVMHCTGWDAFGCPPRSTRAQTGIHPAITTRENIATSAAR
jgi:leucyl-tRNA synthetase